MSHICLVIPPSPFLIDERVFPSLGVLRVASVLQHHPEIDAIDVLDLSGVSSPLEMVDVYLRDNSPNCIGITLTSPQFPIGKTIARRIREQSDTHLIAGGPHVTMLNASMKRNPDRARVDMTQLESTFNTLIAGDGERAVIPALRQTGLIDADARDSPYFIQPRDPNPLPIPLRHLIDMESYHYKIEGVRATSLIAQLGCPFSCGFCGGRNSPSFRIPRLRDEQSVVGEVEGIYTQYGYRGFMFLDDELNVNPRLVELMNSLCDLQERLGVAFRMRGFVKAQLFTDEQAEAMYRAGFRELLIGFESGSPRILRNIRKQSTREQNEEAFNIASRHGLRVKALMSIGHPGERPETLSETEEWILRMRPDAVDVTSITVYPGTPYFDDAKWNTSERAWDYEIHGDHLLQVPISYSDAVASYKGVPGEYQSFVYTDALSCEELVSCRDAIEDSVRRRLGLPYPQTVSEINYEHTMGQLPPNLLRSAV
jgi:anaerobic magnesium-protoporphyrin IX monomethyl ester cyclase